MTVPETLKYSHARGEISHMINWRQKNPTQVFAAIKTTDVGVAVFSETRKSNVRI